LSRHKAFQQSRRERKKIEIRFAHMKLILKLDRLRLRGLSGAPPNSRACITRAACEVGPEEVARLIEAGGSQRRATPMPCGGATRWRLVTR
jgi:hypothetical protein